MTSVHHYQGQVFNYDIMKIHLTTGKTIETQDGKSLIKNAEPHLKPILVTALNTGMRKSEILNLRWEQIDLQHGFIYLDMTKNGYNREIPINTTLRDALQGVERTQGNPFVFPSPVTGKALISIKRTFKTALRRSRIADFRFHDLRHTFASHLVMAGVDMRTIADLLGHKSLSMSYRYAHLAPSHRQRAVGVLDDV